MIKLFDCGALKGKKHWDYSGDTTPEIDGIMPILVTEQEDLWGRLLIINGNAYTLGCLSSANNKPRIGYVHQLEDQSFLDDEDEPEEFFEEDEIKCPYCKVELESFEMPDVDDECTCPDCKSTFSYQREVKVSYSTQPVKKVKPMYL